MTDDELALRRAYKNAENGQLTEQDVVAILGELDLSQPSSKADFLEVFRQESRDELLDLAWRQHIRIVALNRRLRGNE